MNLKTDVTRRQNTPSLPKNKHFLSPRVGNVRNVRNGGKKCSFFGKFGVLCFLVTSILRFALLPIIYDFYLQRRIQNLVKIKDRPFDKSSYRLKVEFIIWCKWAPTYVFWSGLNTPLTYITYMDRNKTSFQ